MDDPLSFVECRSKFIRPIRLSFDIVLDDDIIKVYYERLPAAGEPWYGYHQSSKYGSGMRPLSIRGWVKANPEALAEALCEELGAGKPKAVRNVSRNYVDLHVPGFVKLGLIKPNYPEQSGKIERINGYVLFADLRKFSDWSLKAEAEQISTLYEIISTWVAQMLVDCVYDYWKLLGDGIMLVWEAREDESTKADCAICAAYELHKQYWYYKKEARFTVPAGFGIAICGGELIKFSSSTFFESCIVQDYLGPVVNQAARLQGLANPGEVFVNKRIAGASKCNWYSFEDVTESVKDKMQKLRGIPCHERDVFKVKHKYFRIF